jgi:hypothetical protein
MEPASASVPPVRTPGVAIFVAILNFINVFFCALAASFLALALVFGNISDFLVRQMSQHPGAVQFTSAMNLFFGVGLVVTAAFGAFFIAVGVGLLRGSRASWYLEIALSILGILSFPVMPFYGAVSAVVVALFFQTHVREYYKV